MSKNEIRSYQFISLFDEENKIYGSKKDQAALFEDIIAWPDPDENNQYYDLLYQEHNIDKDFEYNVNTLSMREPKFSKNAHILAVGCSHSFGIGVPYNLSWPYLVSKSLNVEYSNISKPGTSAMYQIINIFRYCQTFGNPKIILCMFPNFERSRMFVDNKTTYSKRETQKDSQPIDIHTNSLENRPTFLKLPVEHDLLISQQQAFYYNNLFIFMLEQYCRSNKIKLIWSTWANHKEFDKMFNKTYNYYESLNFDFFFNDLGTCKNHEKLKNDYPNIFEVGADAYKGNGHPGSHWHQHIAEFFINKINKNLF